MPFSVQGDSSLAFLREGMVDLVTTQLSIESDANPLDARTVISEWHRTVGVGEDASTAQARRLAARLGSGRLVLGSIVGTSADLTIGASIRDVDGSHRVEASVHGSLDSLSVMVLRLTSQLLARSAGEPARRLAELTGTAVPALRAYLEGRAAYRHGELGKAIERFTDALQQDSTFALAALGMAASGAWSQQSGQSTALRRGLRTGYALRDRLPERDRLLFEGYVLPQTAAPHTAAQQLGAWQRAVDGAPELAEAQYEYGDRLYHSGAQLGIADASERARLAFARALALDSTFAAPLAHLVEIAASAGDVDQTRRLYALYRGDAATADARDFVRWRVAYALRDDRTKAALWSQPEGIGLTALNRIIGFGQMEFAALDDVDRAANELRRRADTRSANTANVLPGQTLHAWALNRGRRTAAVQAVELLASETANTLASSLVYFDVDQVPVLDAMFWDGDSARASAAIGRLERSIAQRPPSDGGALARHYSNLCVTGLWHMSLGHVDAARPALAGLRRGLALRDSAVVHGVDPALCSVMIDAMSPQPTISGVALARLDSVLVTGPYVFGGAFGNLVLARLLNARGEHVAALRAVRRRPYDWDTGPLYLTSYLREEGHLGTITGDTAAARRAWDRYLALRQGAEPAYLASTDAVRRARVLLH